MPDFTRGLPTAVLLVLPALMFTDVGTCQVHGQAPVNDFKKILEMNNEMNNVIDSFFVKKKKNSSQTSTRD